MGSSPIRIAKLFNDYASVAQLVEQGTENSRVVGSIPTGGTRSLDSHIADLAHLVERHLAKVEVAGSNPVIRSNRTPLFFRQKEAFYYFFRSKSKKVRRFPSGRTGNAAALYNGQIILKLRPAGRDRVGSR